MQYVLLVQARGEWHWGLWETSRAVTGVQDLLVAWQPHETIDLVEEDGSDASEENAVWTAKVFAAMHKVRLFKINGEREGVEITVPEDIQAEAYARLGRLENDARKKTEG